MREPLEEWPLSTKASEDGWCGLAPSAEPFEGSELRVINTEVPDGLDFDPESYVVAVKGLVRG